MMAGTKGGGGTINNSCILLQTHTSMKCGRGRRREKKGGDEGGRSEFSYLYICVFYVYVYITFGKCKMNLD